MDDLLIRRREMAQTESAPVVVLFSDVTLNSENTVIQTPRFSSAFVSDFATNKPKKVIMEVYAAIPSGGTTTATLSTGIYNSSAGSWTNRLVAASNVKLGEYNGSTLTATLTLEQISGTSYSWLYVSNMTTKSGTMTFNPNTNQAIRNQFSIAVGVGTRMIVYMVY